MCNVEICKNVFKYDDVFNCWCEVIYSDCCYILEGDDL